MGRNGTLDHARLLAAFGIVFFHAGAPGAAVGYAGLPFFLILLVAIALPAATRSPFGPYAAARARRLLTPWLIWSAIYGALKLAELAVTGAPFASEFAPYMILTGPALHLWFLPFAFIVCLAAYPIIRLASLPLSAVLMTAGGISARRAGAWGDGGAGATNAGGARLSDLHGFAAALDPAVAAGGGGNGGLSGASAGFVAAGLRCGAGDIPLPASGHHPAQRSARENTA